MDYRKILEEDFVPKLRRVQREEPLNEKEQTQERTSKNELRRKIKSKISELLDTKYKDIIKQQEKDFNPMKYKPLLTKYFSNDKNIQHLYKDLIDLQREYEKTEDGLPFKSLVQEILYSLEISKIGAHMDTKTTEHLNSYKDFVEKNKTKINNENISTNIKDVDHN
jgi:hypothetical protein